MAQMTIQIERREHNDFYVRAGDRFADHLCLDEVIATIAALLIADDHWYLRTYAEWAACPHNRLFSWEFTGLLPKPDSELL
jgi:hypothetical protein